MCYGFKNAYFSGLTSLELAKIIYKFVLKKQLLEGLKNLNKLNKVIIAYEPVWSIGTGIIPTENNLIKNVKFIKDTLKRAKKFSKSKVLYGGSVNPKNIKNTARKNKTNKQQQKQTNKQTKKAPSSGPRTPR